MKRRLVLLSLVASSFLSAIEINHFAGIDQVNAAVVAASKTIVKSTKPFDTKIKPISSEHKSLIWTLANEKSDDVRNIFSQKKTLYPYHFETADPGKYDYDPSQHDKAYQLEMIRKACAALSEQNSSMLKDFRVDWTHEHFKAANRVNQLKGESFAGVETLREVDGMALPYGSFEFHRIMRVLKPEQRKALGEEIERLLEPKKRPYLVGMVLNKVDQVKASLRQTSERPEIEAPKVREIIYKALWDAEGNATGISDVGILPTPNGPVLACRVKIANSATMAYIEQRITLGKAGVEFSPLFEEISRHYEKPQELSIFSEIPDEKMACELGIFEQSLGPTSTADAPSLDASAEALIKYAKSNMTNFRPEGWRAEERSGRLDWNMIVSWADRNYKTFDATTFRQRLESVWLNRE